MIPGVEKKEIGAVALQGENFISVEDLKKNFEYSKFLAESHLFEEFLSRQHQNKINFMHKLKQEER